MLCHAGAREEWREGQGQKEAVESQKREEDSRQKAEVGAERGSRYEEVSHHSVLSMSHVCHAQCVVDIVAVTLSVLWI